MFGWVGFVMSERVRGQESGQRQQQGDRDRKDRATAANTSARFEAVAGL